MQKHTKEEWMSAIGEGLHTGFRKGSDTPCDMIYWRILRDMDPEIWDSVLRYTVDGLEYMQFLETTDDRGSDSDEAIARRDA